MTQEVARVEAAIEQARASKSCALVSSGDPGIYAMAGLVFETCKIKGIAIVPPGSDPKAADDRNVLRLEVVPGIPALCAGAALLGAPLTHDFAAISLSDLLTPWDLIEQNNAWKLLPARISSSYYIIPKAKKETGNWKKPKKSYSGTGIKIPPSVLFLEPCVSSKILKSLPWVTCIPPMSICKPPCLSAAALRVSIWTLCIHPEGTLKGTLRSTKLIIKDQIEGGSAVAGLKSGQSNRKKRMNIEH